MKPPKPELQNNRIIDFARQVLTLPVILAIAGFGWVHRLILSGRSDKQARADDQVRQSRARRELRGLPPDHDPTSRNP